MYLCGPGYAQETPQNDDEKNQDLLIAAAVTF
jgi:hypothetical protein